MPENTPIASECYYASKYHYANVPDQLWDRNAQTYGNMAESELLCVWVATLLRNKYASIIRVIIIISQNWQDFYLIVQDIYLAYLLPIEEKNIDIALAKT